MRLRKQTEKRWPEMASQLALEIPARATSGTGVEGPVGQCGCFPRCRLTATAIKSRSKSAAQEMTVGPYRPARKPRHRRTWHRMTRCNEIATRNLVSGTIMPFARLPVTQAIEHRPVDPHALQLHYRASQMFGSHRHQHLIGKHPMPMPASRGYGRTMPPMKQSLMQVQANRFGPPTRSQLMRVNDRQRPSPHQQQEEPNDSISALDTHPRRAFPAWRLRPSPPMRNTCMKSDRWDHLRHPQQRFAPSL